MLAKYLFIIFYLFFVFINFVIFLKWKLVVFLIKINQKEKKGVYNI